MYDIAATLKDGGKSPLIIHCGKVNNGHGKLLENGWRIITAKSINNFFSDDNKPNIRDNVDLIIMTSNTYYSISGMLYQIVTRAVSELKIIVLGNLDLYNSLLKIKNLSFLSVEIDKDVEKK